MLHTYQLFTSPEAYKNKIMIVFDSIMLFFVWCIFYMLCVGNKYEHRSDFVSTERNYCFRTIFLQRKDNITISVVISHNLAIAFHVEFEYTGLKPISHEFVHVTTPAGA